MRYALMLLIAAGFVAAVAATGCKKTEDPTTADDIKVGVFLSLSDKNADFGKTTLNGIQLAVDQVNASGGVNGKKITLVTKDTRSSPEQAQTVAKELATQDKVAVAIGSVESGQSIKAAPVFQEAGIPMVSPSSTNPDVTKQGDCIFRVCYLDDFQGAACAAFAFKDLGFRKAAIIFAQDDDYSKGLADFFRTSFKGMGGSIVEEAAFQGNASEFKDQVTKIAAANPDVIFAPVYYSSIGLIARDFRKQGVQAPLLGGDGWESPQLIQLAGETLEGCYFGYHYDPEDSDPKVQGYLKDYKEKFGTEPNSLSALGYDAVYTVVKAIELGGGASPAQIKDGLTKVKDFHGVTGTYSIDANRNAQKAITMLKIGGTDLKKVKVIQPSDIK
jgi:branched-chain amino acid transport system substrate-binding protein